MSKSARATLARHFIALNSGEVDETFISGVRRALHANARRGDGLSVSSIAPRYVPTSLLMNIKDEPPRIAAAQSAKGLAWLRNIHKTPKGTVRKSSPFTALDTEVMDNFSHFTLQGFHWCTNYFCTPVYRVHDQGGNWFDYIAVAWQSGGSGVPEVLQRSCKRNAQ